MLSFLPNRGIKTRHYLPQLEEIIHGDVYLLAFDFSATPALGTADHSEAIARPMLVTHTIGYTNAAQGSFAVQIFHQHGQEQRLLFPKPMMLETVLGHAQTPLILKSPYFVDQGDTLTVEISNVGKTLAGAYASANIQVVIGGVHP